jgi:cobalt-zinc-cadmium efflux system protein
MHPELPAGGLMAGIAAIGLAVNLAVGLILVRGDRGNLNLRAALLHVGGDALGAFGVIVGGLLILATGAAWIDPLLSLLVAAIIIAGVVRIAREATDVLLESVPGHVEVPAVRSRIGVVDGVVGVHDLHVWTIGSGAHALSAHVVLDDRKLSEATLIMRAIDAAMHDDFAITHVTVQFECESCDPDTTIVCTQVGSASG